MKHKHTIEQLREAAKTSTSFRNMLAQLGIAAKGGNYKTLKKRCQEHNIDVSHFLGHGWARGTSNTRRKRDIAEYLTNQFPINSNRLRKRLLSDGILPHQCSSCGLSEWLGGLIPLELDHISGNNDDNSLSNLRLLCPNCHALTPTYRGKNMLSKT